MKQPIFSRARPPSLFGGCAGVTLFEMMVALAVLALATSLVTLAMIPRQPAAILEARSQALVLDLELAAAEARRSGSAVALVPTETGYTIPALGREVRWEADLIARWQELTPHGWHEVTRLEMSGPALSAPGFRIQLHLNGEQSLVQVQPLTGQVDHV